MSRTAPPNCKLTPLKEKRIVAGIREDGLSLEQAGPVVGVSGQTVRNWRRQGLRDQAEGKDTIFSRFAEKVEKAEAQYEQKLLKLRDRKIEKDPRAAADIQRALAAKWPGRYSERRVTQEHQHVYSGGVEVDVHYNVPMVRGADGELYAGPPTFIHGMTGGREPIDIPAAKRRAAARLLSGDPLDEPPVIEATVVEDDRGELR